MATIIDPTTLTIFTFDITTSEGHQHATEWTSNPVETGLDVSDNAREVPDEVTIDGVVTDHPLLGLPLPDRAKAAYEKLLKLKESHALVLLVTELKVYKSMAITSISTSTNPQTGKAVMPSVSLRKIRIVQSIEIPVPPGILAPPVKASGQSPVELGQQSLDMAGDGTEADPFALVAPDWAPNADNTSYDSADPFATPDWAPNADSTSASEANDAKLAELASSIMW